MDFSLGEKTYLKKKWVSTGFCWVVQVMGQPGFAKFFLIQVFCLTRTSLVTGSNGAPDWSGFNNYDRNMFN